VHLKWDCGRTLGKGGTLSLALLDFEMIYSAGIRF